MQTQFDGRYPQHGRAFLTADFVAAAFEGGRRGLLCSRAFLYSLCFILLYRRFTCFGSILRNLSFWFPPEFFGAWLPRFLFVCCSIAGGIKTNSRNLYQRLSACRGERGRQAEMPQSFLSQKLCDGKSRSTGYWELGYASLSKTFDCGHIRTSDHASHS